jgi:hypothetical protein
MYILPVIIYFYFITNKIKQDFIKTYVLFFYNYDNRSRKKSLANPPTSSEIRGLKGLWRGPIG